MGWTASRPFGTATRSGERLGIAVAVGAMGTLGFAMTSPILPDLATELDVSRGAVGLVQAAVSLPGVLFSAAIGYLADRVGRRRVILVALVLFTLCGVGGFFARSFWALVAVRFCQGVGTSGILGVGRLVERYGAARMFTGVFWLMALGAAIAAVAPSVWILVAGLSVAGLGFGVFQPQAQSYSAEVGGTQHRGLTVLLWVTVVRSPSSSAPRSARSWPTTPALAASSPSPPPASPSWPPPGAPSAVPSSSAPPPPRARTPTQPRHDPTSSTRMA